MNFEQSAVSSARVLVKHAGRVFPLYPSETPVLSTNDSNFLQLLKVTHRNFVFRNIPRIRLHHSHVCDNFHPFCNSTENRVLSIEPLRRRQCYEELEINDQLKRKYKEPVSRLYFFQNSPSTEFLRQYVSALLRFRPQKFF